MTVGESWGRYPRAAQDVITLAGRERLPDATDRKLLPYGNGRSYGDSCLNDQGRLLDTRRLDHYIAFDPETGVLRCEAGVQLATILDLVVPQGWFLPVSPGTRFVTVGGAIANDVHGKNHHVAGNFGHHVRAFELLRSDGSRLPCAPDRNAEWFAATIGGLGLTGLITWAEIGLQRIASPWMAIETCKFRDLDGFFSLSEQSAVDYDYSVAWIDCVARGKSLGRGLFTRGHHAPADTGRKAVSPARPVGMPFTPPFSLVNPLSLRAFNALYFHRQLRARSKAICHYEPFFYPLDKIANWNRMYGKAGFLQYQCVVPPANAAGTVAELLRRIATSGTGSFLAVLKQFGSRPSLGMLSFPRPGTTLALDFPIDARGRVFELLNRLDDVVAEAGGAVYPAKDARMSGSRFRQYFPAWKQFQAFIDPHFSSSFWRRVMEP
ncbi:MAG TPA: FAD-binding oxidoreductase [Xanthomonadaceae bacterium]|jgi:FAD/FMN-containing dehydrogenase|nr:FAD-binding oxidoreductase [Xanthomonadaceae bacterium]